MTTIRVLIVGTGKSIKFYSTEGERPFFSPRVDNADYFLSDAQISTAMAISRSIPGVRNDNLRMAYLQIDL